MPQQAHKSLFDIAGDKKSTDEEQNQPNTSSTSQTQDPETSSIFTQSTIQPTDESGSSRFNFFHRNKPSQDQNPLLPNESEGKEKKKKSRFENPFKAHEMTEEDKVVMERIKERLGSREEAVKRGAQGPAGYKGVGGGAAMGAPWT